MVAACRPPPIPPLGCLLSFFFFRERFLKTSKAKLKNSFSNLPCDAMCSPPPASSVCHLLWRLSVSPPGLPVRERANKKTYAHMHEGRGGVCVSSLSSCLCLYVPGYVGPPAELSLASLSAPPATSIPNRQGRANVRACMPSPPVAPARGAQRRAVCCGFYRTAWNARANTTGRPNTPAGGPIPTASPAAALAKRQSTK